MNRHLGPAHTDGLQYLLPDWPAPGTVRAACTLRGGGVSLAPYASLNLGDHVGDDPTAVAINRARIRDALNLPEAPRWLRQVHGTRTVAADGGTRGCEADASHTDRPDVVCAVLTADCLPLLLCDRTGTRVAVAHAGWRGLHAGVIEASVDALQATGADLMAWLGPAIGPDAFEVGAEVRAQFLADDAAAATAFRPSVRAGYWLADLYALARLHLVRRGVTAVYGGGWCTHRDAERFFSYRRDGVTGRMATLIWLDRR